MDSGEKQTFSGSNERLPRLFDRAGDSSVFSMEIGADGVRLRLAMAILGHHLAVKDLVLYLPYVKFPIDFSRGPRSLRNELAVLESCTLLVDWSGVWIDPDERYPIEITGFSASINNSGVLFGDVAGIPFSLSIDLNRPTEDESVDLVISVDEVLVFDNVGISWDSLYKRIFTGLRSFPFINGPYFISENRYGLVILRPVLRALVGQMGFKSPLIPDMNIESIKSNNRSYEIVFSNKYDIISTSNSIFAVNRQVDYQIVEKPSFDVFEDFSVSAFSVGARRTDEFKDFISKAICVPRLRTEIRTRSHAMVLDYPECLTAHVAGVIAAINLGDLDSLPKDLSRLMSVIETANHISEGQRTDNGPVNPVISRMASGFAARCSRLLSPVDSLNLLNSIRSMGFENADVLRYTALALDRNGDNFNAEKFRKRALGLMSTGRISVFLEEVCAELDSAGLYETAQNWLRDVIKAADSELFASESREITRKTTLLLASRASIGANGVESSRRLLLDLIETFPGDESAVQMLVALADTDREVARAVEVLKSSAGNETGIRRAEILTVAGRIVRDRLRLKSQAIALFESAIEVDPSNQGLADELDDLYRFASSSKKRMDFAKRRLVWTKDRDLRSKILEILAQSAFESGSLEDAANAIREVLSTDPTNSQNLELAERIFLLAGDSESHSEVVQTMRDIGLTTAVPEMNIHREPGLETALIDGDLDAALGSMHSAALSLPHGPRRLESWLDMADMALVANDALTWQATLDQACNEFGEDVVLQAISARG